MTQLDKFSFDIKKLDDALMSVVEKGEEVLPGYGLVGMVLLTANVWLTSKGIPLNQDFFECYLHDLRSGEKERWAGLIFAVSNVLMPLEKYKIIDGQMVFSGMGIVGCGLLLKTGMDKGNIGTIFTACGYELADFALLTYSPTVKKLVEAKAPVLAKTLYEIDPEQTKGLAKLWNKTKEKMPEITATTMTLAPMPILHTALQTRDVAFAGIATLWWLGAYLVLKNMKRQNTITTAPQL